MYFHAFSKRPLSEKTPNIRPIKVRKSALPATLESQASVLKEKELDDAIVHSFIGKSMYILYTSEAVANHSCKYVMLEYFDQIGAFLYFTGSLFFSRPNHSAK